jgi:hypothetical protein
MRSLVEKPAFTRMNLFDVRVITTIMCILVQELLCQAVTGRILVLECVWAPVVMPFHARH